MVHTVRTQLDHFQLVTPRLLNAFTVYVIDLPGMGWSDVTTGRAIPSRRFAGRSSSS